MMDTTLQRPATVAFGGDMAFTRRGSRAYSQHDKETERLRRQSIKYQFPNPALECEIKESDLDDVDEDEIRRKVFGKPITEMIFVGIGRSVRRPTISSARHCVLWARDRILYEESHRQQAEEFNSQPYMRHEYPSLRRHYPGTWKSSSNDEIQATTDRLSHTPAPTAASLHLHKYHSDLYRRIGDRSIFQRKDLRRRPKTANI